MNPWRNIERSVREASGTPFSIESRAGLGGGCINECYAVRGQRHAFFVKVNRADKASMFAAEAAGLEEVARTRTVRVPTPVCHGANGEAS